MTNRLFYVGWHIPNLPPKLANQPLTVFPPENQIWPFQAKSGDLILRVVRDSQAAKKLYHGPLDFGMKTSGTQGNFTKKGYTKVSGTLRGKINYILTHSSYKGLYTFMQIIISFCQYYPRISGCTLYRGKKCIPEPVEAYVDSQTGLVIVFSERNYEFITGYRFGQDAFDRLINEKIIYMGCSVPPKFSPQFLFCKDQTYMDVQTYLSLNNEIDQSSVKLVFENEPATYKKFLEFEDRLKEEVLYGNREEYFNLIRSFVKDTQMSYEQFTENFFTIYERDEAKIEELRNDRNGLLSIEFVSRPFKISNLIEDIFGLYDYMIDFGDTADGPTFESEFRESIVLFSKTWPISKTGPNE